MSSLVVSCYHPGGVLPRDETGYSPEPLSEGLFFDGGGGGGGASSAWHTDQMGQPPPLDVWACAQSNVQWWMSIRSAGGICSSLRCACIQDKTDGACVESVGAGGVGGALENVGGRRMAPDGAGECR